MHLIGNSHSSPAPDASTDITITTARQRARLVTGTAHEPRSTETKITLIRSPKTDCYVLNSIIRVVPDYIVLAHSSTRLPYVTKSVLQRVQIHSVTTHDVTYARHRTRTKLAVCCGAEHTCGGVAGARGPLRRARFYVGLYVTVTDTT